MRPETPTPILALGDRSCLRALKAGSASSFLPGTRKNSRRSTQPWRRAHLTVEGLEQRELLSVSIAGEYFVASDGGAASISDNGNQLVLVDEFGHQTTGQWLTPTASKPGARPHRWYRILPARTFSVSCNSWNKVPEIAGEYFVASDGGAASISDNGNQLTLVDENGHQTTGQWLTPNSFQAWGETPQVVQDASGTHILWSGNSWNKAPEIPGEYFVASDGGAASISDNGNQLTLVDENGHQTTGQWLTPNSFQAWGQTARVVYNATATSILWSGNSWIRLPEIAREYFVASDGGAASISDNGNQLTLVDENGHQTTGQWLTPNSFQAWGETPQVVTGRIRDPHSLVRQLLEQGPRDCWRVFRCLRRWSGFHL